MSDPSFPIDTLTVRPWADPVVDAVGHDPRSKYVERFWLGVLGPSSTWLLRRFADGLDDQPAGYQLDLLPTAQELGLGMRGGRHSPFMRSIARCCQFGLAHHFDERTLLVRRSLPPLSARQLDKLPAGLRLEHSSWADPPPAEVAARREHAQRMALTLLELGESAEAVEAMLHRWRVHPALAHEALRWAQDARAGTSPASGSASTAPAAEATPAPVAAVAQMAEVAHPRPAAITAGGSASTTAPMPLVPPVRAKRIPPPPPYIADPLG